MESQKLDYAQTVSKLLDLLDEQVECSLRGHDGSPPTVAYWEGALQRGRDLYGSAILGYSSEALLVLVGDAQITLHPEHFIEASWSESPVRLLRATFGCVTLNFRASSVADGS